MSIVVLDRDGVINHDSPDYIKSPEEWHLIEGSDHAIAMMGQKGYRVFVATNQSGLARGYYDEQTLSLIHQKMQRCLELQGGRIEGIAYCPHGPDDHCECRKPKPGLLAQLEKNHHIDLKGVPFVGDSLRDLQAGINHGAEPVLVKTGNGIKTLDKLAGLRCQIFDNLFAFADQLPDLS